MVLSAAGEFWALLVPEQGLAKIPQCFSFDLMFLMGGLLIQKDNIPEAWKFVSGDGKKQSDAMYLLAGCRLAAS